MVIQAIYKGVWVKLSWRDSPPDAAQYARQVLWHAGIRRFRVERVMTATGYSQVNVSVPKRLFGTRKLGTIICAHRRLPPGHPSGGDFVYRTKVLGTELVRMAEEYELALC